MQWRLLLPVGLLLAGSLAGCLGDDGADDGGETALTPTTSVFERREMDFVTDDPVMSHVLDEGAYGILPGRQYFVPVELGPEEGVPAVTGVDVSIGVHFPDIPGCDWDAEELPQECRVPVISDVGPYYRSVTSPRNGLPAACDPVIGLACVQEGEPDAPVDEYTNMRLLGTLVHNFVPHGYAVAAVSVLGTGDSGHCMDLMGSAEQAGVQAAVEFMGGSPFSNGAVALTGRSYDGSTPWEAAMGGSPYLKTVVPISGLMGQHDLMWRNGSAEFRGPGVLYALYAMYTQDGEVDDGFNALCPDYLQGGAQGVVAYSPAGTAPDAAAPYWSERYFYDDVLANYQGSIYYIHGMQDWNVDNHQAFPYYNQLLDAGFEMKGLFGQWGHMYPDRAAEHARLGSGSGEEAYPASVRMDWSQDLLEWFDHYLKGTGAKPDLHVEIQDNMGAWRIEEAYPPRDAERVVLSLTHETTGAADPAPVAGVENPLFNPVDDAPAGTTTTVTYRFDALSETQDTRIAGNVLFHPTVTPTGPGGQLYAELRDAENGLRLGHAIMDLRYHAGGKEPQTVVPGEPIVAKMEFFALDAVLPASHGLELSVAPQGRDYLPSSVSDPVLVHKDGSRLIVPTIERDDDVFFTPPGPSG